jgi:alkanesulfonate monooxygenase SsuD/methylene tetrahydromethanopterin reductase-like flavin-dependent oxidoreductase (luciferase family)
MCTLPCDWVQAAAFGMIASLTLYYPTSDALSRRLSQHPRKAASMEFGVFHDFPRRAGQSEAEAFAEGLALVDAAERWGVDVMWLAEFHFNASTVLASPLVLAAAVAGRTERMRIGTAVQVLPLGHPLRLAEEWATVDQISRGRLIFGCGRASSPRSYMAYGIPYAESRERFAEALAIIRQAWTEPTFSFAGTFYRHANVSLSPRPYQQPYPPIRVAATSSDTFVQLGAQGFPILVSVGGEAFTEHAPDLAAYRGAYRAAGHAGEGEVYLRISVYVAETVDRAIAESELSVLQSFRDTATQIEQTAARLGRPVSEHQSERIQALRSLTYEQACRDRLIVGTPDMVARRLEEIRDELGIQGILAELNSGRRIPHAQVMHSLRLLCTEVMPHFR